MGELIIQCTHCGASFGCEREYDKHPCLEEDVKVPFRIKLEPQENEEEREHEQENQEQGTAEQHPSSSSKVQNTENKTGKTVRIKEEPCDSMDVQDEDPLGNMGATDEPDMETDLSSAMEFTEGFPNTEAAAEEAGALDTPVMKVTDAVSIRNECGVCGKRFYRREDFLNHTTNSHKIPRPFQCKVCKKRFTQKHYVTLHMRVHTGERPYKCKLCSNTYTHKTSYTIHMRIHNGDRPYICGICGKKCYDKSGLTSHMRSHTKETPYECEVCGRRFTHSKSLLVHRRNHTGEKPYKCQYCGKCFRHWHKHKIHIRLHTGERPYKCEVCGKGFPRNDEVKRHMRSHQGIKSFKCSICGVYCATQASITGHIDLHHADLRQIPLNAPEKTVVKNSTCGILGTKAPQPRSIYKPVVSASTSIQCSITPVTTTHASVLSTTATTQSKTTTTKAFAKKSGKQTQKSGDAKKQGKEGEKTKVLSYKEFIELQEKLLLCKGLAVKNAQANSGVAKANKSNKDSTQGKTSQLGADSATAQVADGMQGKQQIMLLSAGNNQKGEGLRLVLPQGMTTNKQVILTSPQATAAPTPSVQSTGGNQQLVLGQPSVILPQGQLMAGQQIILLSKPGVQQNSVMLSQPLLLLSGANNQRMVLLPSKGSSTPNTSNFQTILIPSSLGTVTTANSTANTTTTTAIKTPNVVVKQEPGEPAPPPLPPLRSIVPKVVIKQEPGVTPPPPPAQPAPVIKQEPPDDPSFSTDNFCNIRIKQEPLD
ncbi:zinc finger protein 628-like [Portunus trituberculatus]|uniref:zinc finger protein 628-like n=1 Tax=Portunus trituberculatus TaxID=210409 RepID=UPI001E1CEA4E|nr:zinc finger protein 628-like [Portunus trituberculatus]